ncbi:MAG: ESX secretion-associated protein EspG [Actinomycetota bacterium]|nr:ESX secretion-associated protein EspG [Actinomycetota bacterium]MDA2950311.1 ESX secretion-associated protein EspG [Actinomycetota bacterium]
MAREFVAAAHLSVDGVLFLMRLLGIESMPPALALMDNVYYAHDQAVVDDITVPILVEHGLIDINGRVDPTVESWLRVLERPDIEVELRAMEGERMRRAVVARRGGDHVLGLRRDEEVVIQSIWSQGTSIDEVLAGPLWAAIRPSPDVAAPPPAEFDIITMPLDQAEALAAHPPGDMIRELRSELRVDLRTARLLNEVSQYAGQRVEIVMREYRGIQAVQTAAGILVADTSMGRVISAVRRSGSTLTVSFGPGTYARFKAAMADLVGLTPSRNWFAASTW